MPKRKEKLTLRDRMFISEYLLDHNATKAIQRAGYKGKAPSVVGHQCINKPFVKEAIAIEEQKRAAKNKVSADWVLQKALSKLTDIEQSNQLSIKDLYEKDGNMKAVKDWPEPWARKEVIAAMETVELFGKDSKGNKVLRGYLKKARTTEHKGLEVQLLKMIGEHVGVGAFNSTIHAKISGDASQDAVQVETLDVSKLTLEELIAYRAIRKKASGGQDES